MTEKLNLSRREFLGTSGGVLAAPLAVRIHPNSEVAPASSPAEAPTKAPVIDCHVHVGVGNQPGSPMDLIDPWDTFQDPELVLRRMEEVGIDVSCIGSATHTTDEKDNEAVAHLCRRYPGKFLAFAHHDTALEKGRIRSLLFREVHEQGFRGVAELGDQPTQELLDTVRELGIPVLYHPYLGGPYGDEFPALFQEFVPEYPDINFILCHLGSDDSDDWREHLAGIQLAKTYPNVYVDTSAVIITSYLEKAIKDLPAEKILFGSDGADCDSRVAIYRIRVQGLPKEKEQLILGGNMLRLLGGRL